MRKRLGAVRFAEWLRRSHWLAAALALAAVLALRRWDDWRSGEAWVAFGILGLWLALGWLRGRLRRPDPLTALAILDRRGGWNDRFSSAFSFLDGTQAPARSSRRPSGGSPASSGSTGPRSPMDAGASLHLEKAGRLLPGALATLRDALPLPSLRRVWILPLLALLFAMSPLLRKPLASGDRPLSEGMRTAAAEQADSIRREGSKIAELDSLAEEERGELDKLRADVEQLADGLEATGGKSATEVLADVEARARAAERLAGKLGLADDGWASEEMLREMSQHPDTADLAAAVQNREAPDAARESLALHRVLDNPDIASETAERITSALDRTMEKATGEDRAKPVGERVGNASRKLLDRQPRTAAREFEELAKHFREVERRERARDKLENLAEKLREAGSQIGGKELEKMNQLAESGREKQASPSSRGLQPLDSNPLQNQLQQPPPGAEGPTGPAGALASSPNGRQSDAPVPGAAAPQPGEGEGTSGVQPGESGEGEPGVEGEQGQTLSAPVPGEKQAGDQPGQGLAQGEETRDGQGEGGALMAPVPGAENGAPVPGSGAGQLSSASGQGAQGGNEAGSGSAAMFEAQSDILEASREGRVMAQINRDGGSTTRAVEGGARSEEAELARREVVADFLAVEEQALDGQSVPRTRREQVLRYFSEIRRQFEEEGGGGD